MDKIETFFIKQAVKHQDSIAIKDGSSLLTYGNLNKQSNAFAHYLKSDCDVKPGDFIPILAANKTKEIFVAILGILKCGAAYVPINLKNSYGHIQYILKSIKAKTLIFSSLLPDNFDTSDFSSVFLNDIDDLLKDFPEETFTPPMGNDDIAYLAFTSGTTGNSKGVLVTHKNVIATCNSWQEVYKLTNKDRHLQMANIAFDVFTGDWIRALCSGGTLVLCPNEILLQPEQLQQLIHDEKITCAEFVPAVINRLVKYCEKKTLTLSSLRLLICGSDMWLMKDYLRTKQVCNDEVRLINSYGTAETTVDSTFFEGTIEQAEAIVPSLTVPIGKPLPHVQVYILNDKMEKLKTGETGEIYIGGKGVSKGYLGASKLTKERFKPDPFVNKANATMYRTGDVGYLLEDGNISFSGRNQFQVKVNGQRIEFSDVEAIISSHPKVEAAIVIPTYQENNVTQLSAYVSLSDATLTYYEIISYAREYLPYYSMPNKVFEVTELCLTVNGKVDKNATVNHVLREIYPHIEEPCSELEVKVIAIWKDVLSLDNIGVTNDFFQLGGTSLLYLSILDKINEAFNVKIGLDMDFRTVRDMSEYIVSVLPQHMENKAQTAMEYTL